MKTNKKLLIVTQVVDENHPVLGFFCRWIVEFAKHCDAVTVICLEEGSHSLPGNVRVFSLGKEEKASRLTYLSRFYRYVWRERKNYDSVFVHMNPEYLILAGVLWRSWQKKIGFWYMHKSVNLKLRIANFFAHDIFTATSESFRLKSKKINITGHAIDTDFFEFNRNSKTNLVPLIITTGRLSPIKNIHLLLEAAKYLDERNFQYQLKIIGTAGTPEHVRYEEQLRQYVSKNKLSKVTFLGAQPYSKIPVSLRESDLFINLSDTGSVDKAILEAMATGLPVLTSSDAHQPLLSQYGDRLIVDKNPEHIANAIEEILLSDNTELRHSLRALVVDGHSQSSTISKISNILFHE